MQGKRKSITDLSRKLRKNPTPAERRLWKYLRKRQLDGHRFLRQKPIIYKQRNRKKFFFIADFYCAEQNLVIELDGAYHKRQKSYDKNRDLVIKKLGLTVLRFKNEELENMETVLEKIRSHLECNTID
ncbi:MAG: endonuclease domain-containing protein [Balneolaceae bacterium]|nr:endonuclease domain-containing protein [Balneolaceae bacterium]